MDHQTLTLPPDLEKQVRRTLEEWTAGGKVRRLWARDATLWTGADEADWLGWLGIVEDQPGRIDQRSEEHTSELQSQSNLVCRLLLEKKKKTTLRRKMMRMSRY